MPTSVTRLIRAAAIVAALSCLSSCYKYTPVEGGVSAVGKEVELQISERGAIELAPRLGAQLKSVSGRINSFSDETYQLAVTQTTSRVGIETLWRGESASIARAYVTSVGDRQLDKPRSWIVAAIAAIGVAVAGEAFGVDTGLGSLFGNGGRAKTQ